MFKDFAFIYFLFLGGGATPNNAQVLQDLCLGIRNQVKLGRNSRASVYRDVPYAKLFLARYWDFSGKDFIRLSILYLWRGHQSLLGSLGCSKSKLGS